jgi:hypothetical protein
LLVNDSSVLENDEEKAKEEAKRLLSSQPYPTKGHRYIRKAVKGVEGRASVKDYGFVKEYIGSMALSQCKTDYSKYY